MPALKSTPFRFQSFHQSHATFPGFIHEQSPTLDGLARAYTMLLTGMSQSFSATAMMRQGYVLCPCDLAIYFSVSPT